MNNIDKMLVDETLKTKGWKIIEAEILRSIEYAKDKLIVANPTDVVNISKLQERVDILKRTLQIVNNMVK